MKIVRARNNENKLEVFDNRPFVIEVELQKKGFRVDFMDLRSGVHKVIVYMDRESFDKEWELHSGIDSEEDISYTIINRYGE